VAIYSQVTMIFLEFQRQYITWTNFTELVLCFTLCISGF